MKEKDLSNKIMFRSLSIFMIHYLGLIGMMSCQQFNLEEQLTDGNQLVVNGLITDGDGPFEVSITRTVPYLSSDSQRLVTDASVSVIDNFGDTIPYGGGEGGIYRSLRPLFSGDVGATYKLRIVLSDSNIYESREAFLRPMGVLDELKCLNCSDTEQTRKELTGVIRGLEDVENLYRWKIYRNKRLLSEPEDIMLIKPRNSPQGLTNHPINHRTFEVGDTIQIEQLSLTQEMFDFLNLVVDQSRGQAGSSPVLPANAVGNITNLNNPTEEVLGFFGASSIQSKEIVISSGNL